MVNQKCHQSAVLSHARIMVTANICVYAVTVSKGNLQTAAAAAATLEKRGGASALYSPPPLREIPVPAHRTAKGKPRRPGAADQMTSQVPADVFPRRLRHNTLDRGRGPHT